jgi:hypothetical protein
MNAAHAHAHTTQGRRPASPFPRGYQLLLTVQPETFRQFAVLSLSQPVGVPMQVTPLDDQ